MRYSFYGWENTAISPSNEEFAAAESPCRLYEILCELWSEETCAPRLRDRWNYQNRTLGQCSVTAFLVQDIFGGKVYGIPRSGGSFHCYNVVGDCCFDLTSEQFGEEAAELVYEDNPEQLREVHFASEEKKLRYERLKGLLAEYLHGISVNSEGKE